MKKDVSLTDILYESQDLRMGFAKKIFDDISGAHTPGEYRLMLILKKLGRAKLKDIAVFADEAKPAVCTRLGALERKKYVGRINDMTDRRNVYYYVTPRGEKYVEKISASIKESVHRILKPLDGKDTKCLIEAYKKINDVLRKVV